MHQFFFQVSMGKGGMRYWVLPLFLFLYTLQISAQSMQGPRYSCDYGAAINLASPSKDRIISGFHAIKKYCMPGMVEMIYVKGPGPRNQERVDITLCDTDDAILHQADVIPGMDQKIKMFKINANAGYAVGRMQDEAVQKGQITSTNAKKYSTIKNIRGFTVAVCGVEGIAPKNSGNLFLVLKDRYVISVSMQCYKDFGDNHDALFAYLSPFIEAFSLEALN